MFTHYRIGNELYVFREGRLLYKRWLASGHKPYGRVFHENEGLTQFAAEHRRNDEEAPFRTLK
jgi:hypothetical protein